MKFVVINDPLEIREWIKAKVSEKRERQDLSRSSPTMVQPKIISTAIIDPRRINQFIAK